MVNNKYRKQKEMVSMERKMTFNDLPEMVKEYVYWSNAHYQESQRVSYLEQEKHMIAICLRSMGVIKGFRFNSDKMMEVAEEIFDFSDINERIEESQQYVDNAYRRLELVRQDVAKLMREIKEENNA
jgi:hypothetical protein